MATNTVHLDSHAAATLRYIRTSMDAATSLAVPGAAGHVMGTIGLLAATVSSMPALRDEWLLVWLIAAAAAASSGCMLVLRPTAMRAIAPSALVGKFALCLTPTLLAGATMTAVLWVNGLIAAIPGTWLLLYGCALVSASVTTTPRLAQMGAGFAALGLIAFVAPPAWHIAMLGIGFGGLHIVFGWLIGRSSHGDQS